MSHRILCLLLLVFSAARTDAAIGTPERSGALQVDVQRSEVDGQHLYQVTASGTVLAPPAAVWKVLTSYDRMHEFVPDLASCKVISRTGNEAIVEQFGHARLLFVTKAIHLIVRATETPESSIDIALISGDMKQYEARWELRLAPETGGTQVLYSGKMMPDFYVPGLLGAAMVRTDIRHMMAAVLTRLDSERDTASRSDGPAGAPASGQTLVPVPVPRGVIPPAAAGTPGQAR